MEEPLHRRYTHTSHHTFTWWAEKDAQFPFDTPMRLKGWITEISGFGLFRFHVNVFWQLASKNYTDEMITEITNQYSANPVRATVDSLAEKFDKTPRSVIAKLSAIGIYQKVERVTKRGEPVVKKEFFVNAVNERLGRELPSVAKMTKVDLQALLELLD
mgnify:CR=1 FL=1